MKKSVNEMLNAMKVNPIEAEKVYYQKCKRWTPVDFGTFWYEAMKAYPEDEVMETANRLIDYLYENELLDYEYIAEDYTVINLVITIFGKKKDTVATVTAIISSMPLLKY